MSAQRVVLGGSSGISQTAADARYAQTLTRTAVKTAAYTAAAGDNVPVDISSANVTVTLPTAPADGSRIAAKIIAVPGTPGSKSLSISCGGSDVFNKAGGSTTLTLTALFQGVVLQYDHATAIWQVQATDTPLGSGLGAAQLGSDGLLGTPGKGGSGLASSVGFAPSFSYSGALVAVVGAGHFPVPVNGTITTVRASVGTAPTGASVIVDVKKNDSTVFTTTANRPTIAASSTDAGAAVPDTTSVSAGDRLSVDIAQVGTTLPGADLVVVVFIHPS